MSQRSKNREKVNDELDRLNREFIPEYDVILNSSPPRFGKTINTIKYHIENDIPAIVFVDNDKQSKDLYNKLIGITGVDEERLYYWRNKASSCYIMQLSEEETEINEYIISAKSEINEGVNHCKKCFYHKDCYWKWQRRSVKDYDVVLMNKHNIGTVLIDDDELFYRNGERRSIIYDEEIDKPYLTDYKPLNNVDIELFNKIYSLTSGFSDDLIDDNDDFINKIDLIKEMLKVRATNREILDSSFDFSKYNKKYGKLDERAYLEIFFNKIRVNIEIYDYLDKKPAPLPEKEDGNYDFDLFQLEKLFVYILIEKRKDHKIVLLDATPLPRIVDRIKAKVDNFKEIRVDANLFNNQSLIFRINRKGKHVKNSRMSMRTRVINNIDEKSISEEYLGLDKDISYITAFTINNIVQNYDNLNNRQAEYGVATYETLKFKNKRKIEIIKMLKEKGIKNIVYYGNYRGMSNLNECEVMHVIGTDRYDPSALYNLYRYLDGEKSLQELRSSFDKKKYKYGDVLFDNLVKHQRDSAMEQIIFRNMPHMEKRLIIIEGYLPKNLEKYFKHIFPLKIYEESPHSGKLAKPSKRIIKEIINKFLDEVYYNKTIEPEFFKSFSELSRKDKVVIEAKFERREKKEARGEIIKLTKKYLSPKYKRKYGCVLKGIFNYLKENQVDLMEKAEITSFSTFERIYYE